MSDERRQARAWAGQLVEHDATLTAVKARIRMRTDLGIEKRVVYLDRPKKATDSSNEEPVF